MEIKLQYRLSRVFLTATLLGVTGITTITTSTATTASLFGKPVKPVPAPNGLGPKHLANQVETSNWSGYAVAHFETGLSYTSASGSWVVPSVTQPAPGSAGYSASWVGIGGYCENSSCHKVDRSLIQLGTQQDISSTGATSYGAWYELLPNPPVAIPVQVSPGDSVAASLVDPPTISFSPGGPKSPNTGPKGPGSNPPSPTAGPSHGPKGSGQSWILKFSDLTTGVSWQTTLTYDSSLASAEWIEEAPTSGGTILPLANFATAVFDHGTVNSGLNPNLVTSDGIVMVDPQGQTSNPSSPDSDSDGFSACWGTGSTLTSCSAQAS